MASGTLAAALAFVLRQEGGFVDHPADPGGATCFGITRATLARARGAPASVQDVRALTKEEACTIYRRLYWTAIRGDELPAGLDLAVFDLAVNAGPGRAIRLLQSALAVTTDGILGPHTLRAARQADPLRTIRALTEQRIRFLAGLPGWPVFGRGWRRRALLAQDTALRLAGSGPPSHPATETSMTQTKPILASRTLWANLVGLAAIAFGMLGFDTSTVDLNGFAEAAAQLVAAASFVASTVFRVAATKQLAR